MLRSIVRRPRFTAVSRVGALTAVAASAVVVAAPAHAEIVSKLPGAGGLPFPSSMVDASTDGRFVLLAVGAPDGAAPGPEADPTPFSPWTLRDRVADTTTPLKIRVTPGGAPIEADLHQISDDGDRVLVSSSDPAFVAFAGVAGYGVFDRSEDRLLRVPTTIASPKYGAPAYLSADGTQVLLRVAKPTGYVIYRGPVGGAATPVIDLPNTSVRVQASADLQTVLYDRYLLPSKRPAPEAARVNEFTSHVIGVRVGTQPPRVVAETTRTETATGAQCTGDGDGITVDDQGTAEGWVSPNGSRLGWLQWHDDEWQTAVRAAGGAISFIPKPANAFLPKVTAFGNANQVIFDPPAGAGYVNFSRELVKDDTELISSVYGNDPATASLTTRYTVAEPFAGAPVPVPAPPITFTTEPVDTATRTSQAVWVSCAGSPTGPVGAYTDYVDFPGNTNYSAKYSIGFATFRTVPSSALRAASRITADLTVFGLPYWKRTISAGSTSLWFPKPLWGIPMNLKITVQPVATPGQAAPAPIVRSYPIWTVKTN